MLHTLSISRPTLQTIVGRSSRHAFSLMLFGALVLLGWTSPAEAACQMTVTVQNQTDEALTVNWNKSQFRSKGSLVWHNMCNREVYGGGVKCQTQTQQIQPNDKAGQTIKAVTGGCNVWRRYRVVTQQDGSSATEYKPCESGKKCWTQSVDIDVTVKP